jgi:hypothetical protein
MKKMISTNHVHVFVEQILEAVAEGYSVDFSPTHYPRRNGSALVCYVELIKRFTKEELEGMEWEKLKETAQELDCGTHRSRDVLVKRILDKQEGKETIE